MWILGILIIGLLLFYKAYSDPDYDKGLEVDYQITMRDTEAHYGRLYERADIKR